MSDISVFDRRMKEITAQRAGTSETTDHAKPTATNDVRGLAGTMVVFGLFGLIPPFTPLGVCLIIVGGVILILSPVAAEAEQHMIEVTTREVQSNSGSGCGAFLWACLVAVTIVLVACGLAGVVVLGGG